jgi:monoterpene epsilon-lactone hydrolase
MTKHGDSAGLRSRCIRVGDRETPLSDSLRLAERARASNVAVVLKVWPHMWHIFQTYASFVPEARRSLDEIGRFVVEQI